MIKSLKKLVLASVAVAALGVTSVANAAITFDIRVLSVSGSGVEKLDDKHVKVISAGGTVNFEVFAMVNGTDGLGTNDGFWFTRGYILAPSGAGPRGNLGNGALVAPFTDSGSAVGSNTDTDGDGFLDLGTTTSSATNSILPRAVGGMQLGSSIPATFKFYSFSLQVSELGSGDSVLQFVRVGAANLAAWQEDGAAKNSSNSTVSAAVPITLTSNVPEPASLGVLVFGGLALLARRRKA